MSAIDIGNILSPIGKLGPKREEGLLCKKTRMGECILKVTLFKQQSVSDRGAVI